MIARVRRIGRHDQDQRQEDGGRAAPPAAASAGMPRRIRAWIGAVAMASTIAHRIAGENGLSVSAVATARQPRTIAARTPSIGKAVSAPAFRAPFRHGPPLLRVADHARPARPAPALANPGGARYPHSPATRRRETTVIRAGVEDDDRGAAAVLEGEGDAGRRRARSRRGCASAGRPRAVWVMVGIAAPSTARPPACRRPGT